MFSAISDSAAASSRKSISSATERRNVSTTSTSRRRRASAEKLSALRATKVKASRSARKRRSIPGRTIFTATARRPSAVATSPRCTCAIEAAATARTEARKHLAQRLAERRRDRRLGFGLRKRRHLVLQAFEIARERNADDIGPRRQELAELDVGRAEPGERSRKPRIGGAACRALDQPRDAQRRPRGKRQRRRIDQAEHAFAGEHEAGAAETQQMCGAGDHKRQPECNATMPPVIGRNDDARKMRLAHHGGERLRLREAADRFDQIAIGLGIAGDRAAERGNDVERIEVVEPVEARHVDGRKFKADEAAADFQHAIRLRKRALDARHVADAECDGHGIEASIGERQRLRIALRESNDIVESALDGALAPDGEHLRIDIAHRRARACAARFDHAQRDVAGAARDIEQRERPLGFRRIDQRDQRVLPGPVQAGRHQVVHQVVAARHAVEHVVHQRLLVFERHLTRTEMRFAWHRYSFSPKTIARQRQGRYVSTQPEG